MEGGHEQCTVQRVAQQLCVRAVQTYRKERFEQPQESPFWEGQPLKGWYQITTNKTGCPPLECVAYLLAFRPVVPVPAPASARSVLIASPRVAGVRPDRAARSKCC